MTASLQRARFPALPAGAGHYESFYLKLSDPRRPRGAWIRYTVLKRPGHPPVGSVWCTLWPGPGDPPEARKVTLPHADLGADAHELIQMGASRLQPGKAVGVLPDGGWQLEYTAAASTFPYLPRRWMYRTRLPRTKAVSLAPLAMFSGEVTIGAHTLRIDGWPGMVGHNWGAEHAERWVWLHAAGFPGAADAWLDATLGRVRVGGITLPWVANGGLWLDGRLHRLGGPSAIRATSVSEESNRCRFVLPGRGLTVHGEVSAPEQLIVAWQYADPAGGRHFTCNCSVASLTVSVRRDGGTERSLQLPAGAAYELGAREPPAAIAVQPYSDP